MLENLFHNAAERSVLCRNTDGAYEESNAEVLLINISLFILLHYVSNIFLLQQIL
jgi:hypothetical protein